MARSMERAEPERAEEIDLSAAGESVAHEG